MHVFIDTNILLTFYHFTDEELDALDSIFASHEYGATTVHLTQQVKDEFTRNRENKIKDALTKFSSAKFNLQIPSFIKTYPEYKKMMKLSKELQTMTKEVLEQVKDAIANKELLADKLIGDIFAKAELIKITDKQYSSAIRRTRLGNPPGKKDSIGDVVNWLALLDIVPTGEPLHLISADGDFYSSFDETKVNPFLSEEWTKKKKSDVFVYRNLAKFINEHFDGIAFSFDVGKEELIDSLAGCGSFASTHSAIAKLESYPYFSTKEVKRILEAACSNDQFGWIVSDDDIATFLTRIAGPKMGEITEPELLKMLMKVKTND